MVKIFNIKKNEKSISCNYIPETSSMAGYVEFDTETHEITKIKYSDYEYGKKMYVAQVCSKISELLSSNSPLPKELTFTWY